MTGRFKYASLSAVQWSGRWTGGTGLHMKQHRMFFGLLRLLLYW